MSSQTVQILSQTLVLSQKSLDSSETIEFDFEFGVSWIGYNWNCGGRCDIEPHCFGNNFRSWNFVENRLGDEKFAKEN